MTSKICSKCKCEKQTTEFNKQTRHKDGFSYWCKSCKLYYNRENRERINAVRARRRLKNKIKERLSRNEYSRKNRTRIRELARNRYEKNKEKERARCLEYYHKNKKKLIPRTVEMNKFRRNTNLLENFKCKLRSRLKLVINKKYKKSLKTIEIVGCSVSELMNYLEARFKPGMSWENRSLWHIDHIIPLSSAKSIDDVYVLFHYTNLQPLWAKENLRKGARYESNN